MASSKQILDLIITKRPGLVFDNLNQAIQNVSILFLTLGTQITTLSYNTVGDNGGAIYAKVLTEPTHQGKFQDISGSWWEIKSNPLRVEMFGAFFSESVSSSVAIQNAVTTACFLNRPLHLSYGTYCVDEPIVIPDPTGSYSPLYLTGPTKPVLPVNQLPCARIKKISGGSTNAFIMASAGWVNSTNTSYKSPRIENILFDGNNISNDGYITSGVYPKLYGVQAQSCLRYGIYITRTLSDGVTTLGAGGYAEIFNCKAMLCGWGLRCEDDFADTKCIDCQFSRCNVAIDVLVASAWRIDGLDTWSDRDPEDVGVSYCSRLVAGGILSLTNSVFGNSNINDLAYNLQIDASFYVVELTNVNFQNGNGLLVNYTYTNNLGKVILNHCQFAKGSYQSPRLWHGTNSENSILVSRNCLYTLDAIETPYPYMRVPGNTLGVIIAEKDTYQDGTSTTLGIVYDGWQPYNGWQTNNPGLEYHDVGTSAVVVGKSTLKNIVFTSTLTTNRYVVLPAVGGRDATYTIQRLPGSGGDFSIIASLTDGGSAIATLSSSDTWVTLGWSDRFSTWVILDQKTELDKRRGSESHSGANTVQLTRKSAGTLIRNFPLTANTGWVVPSSPRPEQEHTVVRTAAATGAFSLIVYAADGTTPFVVLNDAATSISFKYCTSVANGTWIATNKSTL